MHMENKTTHENPPSWLHVPVLILVKETINTSQLFPASLSSWPVSYPGSWVFILSFCVWGLLLYKWDYLFWSWTMLALGQEEAGRSPKQGGIMKSQQNFCLVTFSSGLSFLFSLVETFLSVAAKLSGKDW